MSAPSPELIDELYREDVLWARAMTAAQRAAAGGELFDEVCERMLAGIRQQYPEVDEQRVQAILRERLEIARRLEQSP